VLQVQLVLEYCDGGSLRHLLNKQGSFTLPGVHTTCAQLLPAMNAATCPAAADTPYAATIAAASCTVAVSPASNINQCSQP
jgi:serine/threonine protein kinase